MLNRIRSSKMILAFFLVVSLCASLSATDAVFLKDGGIILGSLIGPVEGGVAYRSFGSETIVSLDSIATAEKNLDGLAQKNVQIILKDGSAMQGKIVDYDDEIGVFLDISFGTLTIPTAAVDRIIDIEQKNRYAGATYQLALYGGFYKPLGDSSDCFGPSWSAGAGIDWAVPFVRGLYAGARATVYGMDYTEDNAVKYTMVSLRPEVCWKYLGWRSNENFLSKIVPYAAFGAGPVYIAISDPDSYPSDYGSITTEVALSAGVEFSVSRNIVVKLEGIGSTIFQKDTPFVNAGANLSICYER